jgi:hypothetical protein
LDQNQTVCHLPKRYAESNDGPVVGAFLSFGLPPPCCGCVPWDSEWLEACSVAHLPKLCCSEVLISSAETEGPVKFFRFPVGCGHSFQHWKSTWEIHLVKLLVDFISSPGLASDRPERWHDPWPRSWVLDWHCEEIFWGYIPRME